MAQPASLNPASTNATTKASSPPPTHYYLARLWCNGARPRNAMNLVRRKSRIREKTGLGAWGRRQAQPGDWGWRSGCFFQIREIREKTDFRGGKEVKNKWEGGGGGREHLSSASIQWKQVYATLPYFNTVAGLRFTLTCQSVCVYDM